MSESTTFSKTEKPNRLEQHPFQAEGAASQPLMDTTQTGYVEELLYNNTILAIHINDLDRATIDTWARHNYDLRMGWADITRPLFLMVSFGERIEAITPYAREKARDMNVVRPDLPSVVAVVVPDSVIGQVLKLLIWGLSRVWQTATLHIFFDSDEALAWLKRQVDYALPRSTSV